MGDCKTILLVEDTPELLETLRQLLEAGGYKVICASDGEMALKILARQSLEIDLLITDLSLGAIDGVALAQRFLFLNSAVRVLFISGDGRASLGEPNLDLLVVKPFTGKSLIDKVRAVLGEDISQTNKLSRA